MMIVRVENPGTPEETISTVVRFYDVDKCKRARGLAKTLNRDYATGNAALEFRAVPQ